MGTIESLGARVHLFLKPERREAFTRLFRDVLGCQVLERDFGLAHPLLFVPFKDGSGFSVEFGSNAPDEHEGRPVTDENAFRGAWIEFRTDDVQGMQQRLRDAGTPEFKHLGSQHVYFTAPGGQVFRLLEVGYKGP